jgi:H/ACA ribonucleoprotein complex subunit 3
VKLKKCSRCGEYTLKDECACGGGAASPEPPRFSWPDRHWKERLKARGVA